MIVVHHDLVGNRLGLASQHKAGLKFPRLERIVHVHLGLALHKPGTTSRAHTALAGERQVDTGAERGIEDRFVFRDRHLPPLAVNDERGQRFWRRTWRYDLLRTRLAAEAGDEAFDMNTLFI